VYSEFFKLRVNPFGETPDTKFYYRANTQLAAFKSVTSAIREGKGFTLVSGEVGVGKTIFSRFLLNSLGKHAPTALILSPIAGPLDMLTSIREEFGLSSPSNISLKSELDLIYNLLLATAAAKKRTILIIDEAQRLPFDALETVRLLSNFETEEHKLLQIVLIGQPELKSRLEQSELRQLSQRITVRTEIHPLTPTEVAAYVRHRIDIAGGANFVRFSDGALFEIAKLSSGLPRLINFHCEQLLSRAELTKQRWIDCRMLQDLGLMNRSRWRDLFSLPRRVSL